MSTKTVTVENAVGIHARPATMFIGVANNFVSKITILKAERKANGKSLLGMLSLEVKEGDSIEIRAEGPDEEEAVESLYKLIRSDFKE